MTQVVSPSNDSITAGQIGKAQELLAAALRKSGLLSEPVQTVLETQGDQLAADMLAALRKRVEAISNLIVRHVTVNRKREPKTAIAATGRQEYLSNDVVKAMPRGAGSEVDVVFFKLDLSAAISATTTWRRSTNCAASCPSIRSPSLRSTKLIPPSPMTIPTAPTGRIPAGSGASRPSSAGTTSAAWTSAVTTAAGTTTGGSLVCASKRLGLDRLVLLRTFGLSPLQNGRRVTPRDTALELFINHAFLLIQSPMALGEYAAAIVSKGYKWPLENTTSVMGSVVLLSAEDDPADTIKPRLDAALADCDRIHVLSAVQDTDSNGKPTQRMFSLKRDVAVLEELLPTIPDCRLLVIDPISAYLEGTDSHNNGDVRSLLAPLTKLAADYNIAIVLVQHLNKNSGGSAMYRSMGSVGFMAAARAGYIVAKDQNNPDRRLVMPAKNNLAKDNTGLAYSVQTADNGAPVLVWEAEPVL